MNALRGQKLKLAHPAPEEPEEAQALHNEEALRMIEALLFATAEPLDEKSIAKRLPEGAKVRELLEELSRRYADRGVNLVKVAGKWAIRTATLAGWPDESIHSEQFSAPPVGKPFIVKLARSAREITVGGHQSILEALEQNGIDAPFLCRGGACGQCETAVMSCDGFIEHNDHYLTEPEKATGRKIMLCVSRISGDAITLDL